MSLSDEALAFYEDYLAKYRRMQGAAAAAEFLVADALQDLPVELHVVTGRAKHPLSLLKKLRSEGYTNPADEVTDQVAVRVITYYDDHVKPVVQRLSERFEVKPGESKDLSDRLPLRAFGYRSYHLVVRAALDALAGSQAQALRGLWFEVQVRSVLAHAWAEIEHEVVYKSGSAMPDELVNRFAQIAANLQSADQEFIRLRGERDQLVTGYAAAYAAGDNFDEELDASRLMAAFEVLRPEALSFRRAYREGTSYAPHTETTCLDALRESGVSTAADLRDRFEEESCMACVESYATLADVLPREISHYATSVLAAGCNDPREFRRQFPDLLDDDTLSRALEPEASDESALDEPPDSL